MTKKKGSNKEPSPPGSTVNRYISSKIIKRQLKEQGVSNSGGQFSDQTDNKQSTINKGQQSPAVQGKKKAAKLPSKSGPKKK